MEFNASKMENFATKELARRCSEGTADVPFIESCVSCGARVEFDVLRLLALKGKLEAFQACLTSDSTINFSQCDGESGSTLLHIIAADSMHDENLTAALMAAVRDRVMRRPGDRVNWHQTDAAERHFLCVAAEMQVLSALWAELSQLPDFTAQCTTNRIPLRRNVWSWDWEALPEVGKALFDTTQCRMIHARKATGTLWKLRYNFFLDEIEESLCAGADPLFSLDNELPALLVFASYGVFSAIQCCIQTPHSLNFNRTTADSGGSTFLHLIANNSNLCEEEVGNIMDAMFQRLQRHPCDEVDWEKPDGNGEDLVTMLCKNQLLSAVWPKIRDVPAFADKTEPIPLTEVWRWDFDALASEDVECFDLESARVIEADRATGRLWKMRHHDSHVVAECIAAGGDPQFSMNPRVPSLLFHYAIKGNCETLAVCLKTARALDFTQTMAPLQYSLLHLLARAENVEEETVTMVLHSIIDHLEQHTDDLIDWGQANEEGHSCISVAAHHGRLSAWWKVMKERGVKFFALHEGPIPLTLPVQAHDFNRLPPVDQKGFQYLFMTL